MRGIIPAHILGKLNSLLRTLGDNRPLCSHFDLIAGTSTGALLSLALAAPACGLPAEKMEPCPVRESLFGRKVYLEPGTDPSLLEGLYEEKGPEIFPSAFYAKPLLYPLFSGKYDSLPFEAVLFSWFGDLRLSSLRAPVMAVCYDSRRGAVRKLSSWEDPEVLIREAALASSAAPTYFPPRELDDGAVLIDGGIAANNPVLAAYSEARKLYPDTEEFRILSLSTCVSPLTFTPLTGGVVDWALPVIRLYGDASLEIADETIKAVPGVKYTRIWSEPERPVKLDGASEEDIQALKDLAEKTYRENQAELMAYARKLSRSPARLRRGSAAFQPLP